MTDPVHEFAVRRVALARSVERVGRDLEKVLDDYLMFRDDLGEHLSESVEAGDETEVTSAYGDDIVGFWDLGTALLAIADRAIDVVDPPLPRPNVFTCGPDDRFVVTAEPETGVRADQNRYLAELLRDVETS